MDLPADCSTAAWQLRRVARLHEEEGLAFGDYGDEAHMDGDSERARHLFNIAIAYGDVAIALKHLARAFDSAAEYQLSN